MGDEFPMFDPSKDKTFTFKARSQPLTRECRAELEPVLSDGRMNLDSQSSTTSLLLITPIAAFADGSSPMVSSALSVAALTNELCAV